MVELPENCPICGKKMEKGFFWIKASHGYGAANYWSYEKPEYHDFWGIPQIKPLEGSIRIMDTKKENYVKPGFRCPNCKIVVFSLEKPKSEKLKRSTEPIKFERA